MPKIWKFQLRGGTQQLALPERARIMTAQAQGTDLVLWAEVEPSNHVFSREISVVQTGDDRPMASHGAGSDYINTVQMPGGIVWHVYAAK